MKISNRLNIVLALVAVFLLILGTNRIDQRHFETAQNAVKSLHNDRVVAQDYIYKLNNLIHKKQLFPQDSGTSNQNINKEIETLITLFLETKLTTNEAKVFDDFKNDFFDLKAKEARYYSNSLSQVNSDALQQTNTGHPFEDNLAELQTDLDNLALIQVSESKTITGNAQKSLDVSNLMSSMELYFLLAIGIIILLVTFYRIDKVSKKSIA
ncbi:hypothetical protein ACFO5T_05750 [Dokdonia genika]|uniref:Chemotaxis methyl-accepting receptor HlyB-like 4HB MCP domain-containing protein n=1 Tax=Dokdonia genika TaxID=308113 RepID=A0ABV9L8D2_9FLAO